MTISVVYEPDVYTGNGVLTTYPITFAFLGVSANVKVSLKSSIDNTVVEKTAATHYNVVGTNVVFEAAYIPIATDTIIIELDPDYLQSSDYVENSNFSAETLERDFDKLKLEVQLIRDTGRRAIRVDSSVDLDVTDPNSTFQSDVGLEIGVDVQAYNAQLTDVAANWTAATTSGAAKLRFKEDVDNGTSGVYIQAPASLAADYTLTLPVDDGTSNQVLKTDGSGNLSWTTPVTIATDVISLTEGIVLGSAGHTGYVKLIDTVDANKSVTLKGFDNLTASYSLQMPANVGTPGYVLSTDGTAGNLSWATNTIATAAAQSDQETATSTTLAVTPGTQHFHPSAAKAWVHINDCSTTPITPDSSYNITSVTDNGTGNYTLVIATDFSGAEFVAVGSADTTGPHPLVISTTEVDAGNCLILAETGAGVDTDALELSVVLFGDQ